jgi:type VI secretion system protein VasI
MTRIPLTILLIPLFALSASSENLETEIIKCATIEDDVKRLTAFDTLAKSIDVAEPVTPIKEGVGKWRIQTDVSPIDDSNSYFLSLDANEELKIGLKTVKPTLVVRYKEANLQLYISYGELFIGVDKTQVTTRFDKGEAVSAEWGISTNRKAIFEPKASSGLRTMIRAKKFVVRLTPYGESPIVTSFDVSGFAQAFRPFGKAMEADRANEEKKKKKS